MIKLKRGDWFDIQGLMLQDIDQIITCFKDAGCRCPEFVMSSNIRPYMGWSNEYDSLWFSDDCEYFKHGVWRKIDPSNVLNESVPGLQPTNKIKPSDVLRSGAQHMEDRAATYDNASGERSMSVTVTAFNAIFGHNLTEEQGWQFMTLLKMVRSNQGDFKLDNYEDGCAYFALAAEAASGVRNVTD